MKLSQRIFWPLAYIIAPIAAFDLYYLDKHDAFLSGRSVGVLAGSFAFIWILNQLIIAARPRPIEKGLGLDRMYRVHTLAAVVGMVLAIVHKQINDSWWEIGPSPSYLSLNLFLLVTVFSLLSMGSTSLQKLSFVKRLRYDSESRSRIRYQTSKRLHNLFVIASIIAYIHIIRSSVVVDNLLLKAYFGLYLFLALSFYLFHKFIRPLILTKDPYLIREVILESDDVTTLRITNEGMHRLNFRPGQFVFISIESDAVDKEQHPFSISSSPDSARTFQLTIRDLGDFTSRIRNVKPGDRAFIEGPYGAFTHLDQDPDEPLFLIAGGIGITPILSMIHHLSRNRPTAHVHIIWCARYRKDLIRYREVTDLQSVMPHLSLTPILSREFEWGGESGRISIHHLQPLADRVRTELRGQFYICGPQGFMNEVKSLLHRLRVHRDHINYEEFSF
jgi:predicted ferric reductase